MDVVINRCKGEFSLSKEAYSFLGEKWDRKGKKYNDDRSNFFLVSCVKALGEEASGHNSYLRVVQIPDTIKEWNVKSEENGIEYVYDGLICYF